MIVIVNRLFVCQRNILSQSSLSKIPIFDFKNFHLRHFKFNKKMNITSHHGQKIITKSKSKNLAPKKVVGSWLLTCSGMVFVAVTLGGITRLTESGLSMVTWKLWGEKIPTNEVSWLNEFEKYKEFPEFKITNKNMTLEEFKRIWWMEYIHRMWGRLIGAIFIVPASYFWMKNMLKPIVKRQILVLGTLIGCQGLMGWYMVKSGLETVVEDPTDIPRVSQYRLAAHLGIALVIYTGLLYTALDHLLPSKKAVNCFNVKVIDPSFKQLKKLRFLAYSSKGLVFLTAISGAFVAGLDAGLIYNTFPKMSSNWVPDDLFYMKPIIKNFTENPTTVQFNHRILGLTTLSLITYMGLMSRKYKIYGRASTAVVVVLTTAYLQATLGILTLLNYVPTYLATLHQSNSLLLLSTTVWLCHEMKYIKKLPK